jgi:hypothetical protein
MIHTSHVVVGYTAHGDNAQDGGADAAVVRDYFDSEVV